jgi:TonB-linked SusC/RagA family outer membrane protein
MKNLFTTLAAVLLFSLFSESFAQGTVTVAGRVTDAGTGETLPGVSVQVKGGGGGTQTDVNGAFKINAPGNGTLVFTYIGYQTQEIPVNNQTTVNVPLKAASQQLEQVVVVGYGTQRRRDVTGAISSVRSRDIANRAVISPAQALQGKAAGVTVTTNSGTPGDAPSVRIRGVGTVGNSNPLYVVDGVFVDDIRYLNTQDIQSMEILKDASSLAIYGVRGANGVIIITTKTGHQGKAQISFDSYYGFTEVAKTIKMANAPEYQQLTREAIINTTPANETPQIPDVLQNPATTSTEWFDQIFRNGAIQNYQLSVSGGSEKVNYNVSGSYSREQGILLNNSYERINVRANNDYKPFNNLKFGHSLAFSTSYSNNIPTSVVSTAYNAPPLYSPTNNEGSFIGPPLSNVGNPLAQIYYTYDKVRSNRFVGNVFGELTLLKDLRLRSSFSTDLTYNNGRVYTPQYLVSSNQKNEVSKLTVARDQFLTILWENTLTYEKNFNNVHRLNILGGATMQTQRAEFASGTRNNVPGYNRDVIFLNTGDLNGQGTTNRGNEYAYLSYLFRTNYSLLDRYLVTLSFRADGSSRFPQDNRYGYFPAIGLGWRLSEEPFMKAFTWLDNLKLRGSYGILGNTNIPDYLYYARISTLTDINNPRTNLGYNFGPDETYNAGATELNSFTSNLLWEKVNQLDLGLEMALLKNKLTFEADYYNRKTKDMVVQLPIQGGNSVYDNAGSVVNKGFEFTIGWNDQVSDDWNYSLNANLTTVKNEVTSLGNGGRPIIGGSLGNGANATLTQVGLPIGAFWGYEVTGVFQNQAEVGASAQKEAAPGDLRFKDVNNDGLIDLANDRVYLGSPIPKLVYALNSNVSFKNFDLSLDLQGVSGNKIYNGKKGVRFGNENFEASILNRWTGPGTSNSEPRVTNAVPVVSSYYIESGNFLRFRTIQLGYTFPKEWISKARVNSLRIFVNALNPFTITDYSGFSPEIGSNVNVNQRTENPVSQPDLSRGLDLSIVPVTRTLSFGVNVGL